MRFVPSQATGKSGVRVERLARAGRALRDLTTMHALVSALPRLAAEVCRAEGCAIARLDGADVAAISSHGRGPDLSVPSVKDAARRAISGGESGRVQVGAISGDPAEISVAPVASGAERLALVVRLHDELIDASADATLEVFASMAGASLDRVSAAERQIQAAAAPNSTPTPSSVDERAGARSARSSRWTARMSFEDLIGEDPAFLACVEMARRAALSDLPVLITGETGTGKEMFAQAIHNASLRRREPFVGINVAAIPLSLLESELFGYEKGAFTSAQNAGKPGLFEVAEGGTLLLDEIGDMPLELQVKLLRVLQERVVYRLGATREVPIRARILATTHRDLRKASQDGSFRSDLYYRLRVVHLRIPALRDRPSDIPRMIETCLAGFAMRHGRSVPELAPRVLSAYMQHDWPGNVRELMHLVEAEASLLAPNENVIHRMPTLSCVAAASILPAPPSTHAPSTEYRSGPDSRSERGAPATSMEELERQAYLEALEREGGNVSKAALVLGVSRGTFYNKMRRYGLEARGRPSVPPRGS